MNKYEYARATEWMRPVYWIEDEPWEAASGLLRPVGSPDERSKCSADAIRRTMKQAGAYGAQWTENWDSMLSGWWHVIADGSNYGLEQLGKKNRYYVRKGLNHCQIRQIEVDWLADHGYEVCKAEARDGRYLPSYEVYRSGLKRRNNLDGFQAWGAFFGDKLVAYVTCLQLDDTVQVLTAYSDPAYLKYYPNNALYYEMTRSYLMDQHCRYVSFGSRVLYHQTHVQDFLLKLGYRRAYATLKLVLRPDIELLLKLGVGSVVRRLLNVNVRCSMFDKIAAMAMAWEISKGLHVPHDEERLSGGEEDV